MWSVNEATAETLRSYGYKGEIEVMPNGVDMATSAPEPELQARVRAQLQLSPDKPLLLFVGQQVNQKNIPMLLEALAIIKRKGVDFQMLSVGEVRSASIIVSSLESSGSPIRCACPDLSAIGTC